MDRLLSMRRNAYTTENISRLDLLGGRLRPSGSPMRPPWALNEAVFQEICTGCDACIDACPPSILNKSRGGYPVVDFTFNGCTFCGDCVTACRPKALVRNADTPPWTVLAVVQPGCLSANGTMCRMCGDRCDAQAISFKLALGGKSNPVISSELCTGCGDCIALCPVNALEITSHVSEY